MLFFISSRFYIATLASLIPGIARLLEGWLVHLVVSTSGLLL